MRDEKYILQINFILKKTLKMSVDTSQKMKAKKKSRYFMETEEKNSNKQEEENLEDQKKRKHEEIVQLRPKKLHREKKKIVSQLKSLHDILGKTREPDEEEVELENAVFGGDFGTFEDYEDKSNIEELEVEEVKRKPAWEDEDDEQFLFKKVYGDPEWAELGRKILESDGESEDELLKKTGNFIKQSENLSKDFINIRKCTSLTHDSMKGAIVKSVEFHPSSRVALVTGTNGIANLFQVDGKLNSKIQSIYLESFPIHTAHFTTDGNEIIAGSNMYGFFYSYDMYLGKVVRIPNQKGMEQQNIRRFQMSPDGKYIAIHGRYGNIHLVTTKTKEWIGSLKMNGEVVAITFSNDGSKLYSHGDCGEVYIWDLNTRKCILKFTDEGCITGTAINISPNNQFLATGSDSGIVNIYDCATLNTSSPSPVKVIKNLTTEITALKFNVTTEVLAMGSSYKIGATRLVHVPSLSVFSNFPAREDYKGIKNVNSLDISPNSGFLAMGNNTGNALLYRLKHYKNY
ncbi:U3 small nucleolar RNA-associated protein 18 homolog [Parasteatoda tepidariorum]|uniref:U3 small nucleolar RNA-associated protein 18 homolog n=1 Tax=Parasteatoda tepidariorum TaxID=114398 RepID=UPI0039BC88D0